MTRFLLESFIIDLYERQFSFSCKFGLHAFYPFYPGVQQTHFVAVTGGVHWYGENDPIILVNILCELFIRNDNNNDNKMIGTGILEDFVQRGVSVDCQGD